MPKEVSRKDAFILISDQYYNGLWDEMSPRDLTTEFEDFMELPADDYSVSRMIDMLYQKRKQELAQMDVYELAEEYERRIGVEDVVITEDEAAGEAEEEVPFKKLNGKEYDGIHEKLLSRLYNWKFNTALMYAEASEPPLHPKIMSVIRKLAEEYGNIGYNGGDRMCERIRKMVDSIADFNEED